MRPARSRVRRPASGEDGRYPDALAGHRQGLREAFSRTAILSNEKYRGIRLQLANGQLKIQANNPEQEEAEEEIEVTVAVQVSRRD